MPQSATPAGSDSGLLWKCAVAGGVVALVAFAVAIYWVETSSRPTSAQVGPATTSTAGEASTPAPTPAEAPHPLAPPQTTVAVVPEPIKHVPVAKAIVAPVQESPGNSAPLPLPAAVTVAPGYVVAVPANPSVSLDPRAVTDQTVAVLIVRPQPLIASPLLAGIPYQQLGQFLLWRLKAIEPANIESCVAYLERGFTNRQLAYSHPLVTVRFAAALEPGLIAKSWPEAQPRTVGDKTYYLERPTSSDSYAVHLVDARTLVLGRAEQVQRYLAATGASLPRATRLAQWVPAADLALVTDLGAMQALSLPLPDLTTAGLPAALLSIPGHCQAASLALSLSQPNLIRVAVHTADAAMAQQIEQVAQTALATWQATFRQQQAELTKQLGPDNASLLELATALVAKVQVARTGTTVAYELPQPAKLLDYAPQLGAFASKFLRRPEEVFVPLDSDIWTQQDFPALGFRAEFPGVPLAVRERGNSGGIMLSRKHDAKGGTTFRIDWKPLTAEQKRKLDFKPGHLLRSLAYDSVPIKLGPYEGVAFTEPKSPQQPFERHNRVFLIDQTLLTLSVSGAPEHVALTDPQRFFNSVQLRPILPTWATFAGTWFAGIPVEIQAGQAKFQVGADETVSVPVTDLLRTDAELLQSKLASSTGRDLLELPANQTLQLTGTWVVDPQSVEDVEPTGTTRSPSCAEFAAGRQAVALHFRGNQQLTIERTADGVTETWFAPYRILAGDPTFAMLDFHDPIYGARARLTLRAKSAVGKVEAVSMHWNIDPLRYVLKYVPGSDEPPTMRADLAALEALKTSIGWRRDGTPVEVTPTQRFIEKELALLASLHTLERLDLDRGGHVSDVTLVYLSQLKRLKSLQLGDSVFTGKGLQMLAELPALEELRLRRIPLGDEALQVLAQFKNLKQLTLDQVGLTNEGMAALSGLTQLEELIIVGGSTRGPDLFGPMPGARSVQSITDEGLAPLASLSNLQRFDISASKVTPAGIARLRKMLPKLK